MCIRQVKNALFVAGRTGRGGARAWPVRCAHGTWLTLADAPPTLQAADGDGQRVITGRHFRSIQTLHLAPKHKRQLAPPLQLPLLLLGASCCTAAAAGGAACVAAAAAAAAAAAGFAAAAGRQQGCHLRHSQELADAAARALPACGA